MPARVLILGGTGEARELARWLHDQPGIDIVSSLAGRVSTPRLPVGQVRLGGFGGTSGLAAYLQSEKIAAVVDATHPFAATISWHAAEATATAGVPLLMLRRPGWTAEPGDRWHRARDPGAAAELVEGLGKRIFLTIGRQGLSAFAHLSEHWFLARCVDPPSPPAPPALMVLLGRGPYTLAGELELMRQHAVDVLVTKDSGGELTKAKLTAARQLGLPVVVVARPPVPEVPRVPTVFAAASWTMTITGNYQWSAVWGGGGSRNSKPTP
jgi:precorrin-6A/cobalt-precorrin-6A reductase